MKFPEKRPLEEISLSGYKSFRELNSFRMHSGLNVLIGANGSGKTNFIRFFEFLGNIMDANKGLQNYISSRGRADAFLFQGIELPSVFRLPSGGFHATRFSSC
jgi:predicted ATPase